MASNRVDLPLLYGPTRATARGLLPFFDPAMAAPPYAGAHRKLRPVAGKSGAPCGKPSAKVLPGASPIPLIFCIIAALLFWSRTSRQEVAAMTADFAYQSGFGNEFATEAAAGALPTGQNSPQRPPLGLYAEQL